MAQQIIPAAQLVPKFQSIGRCNNYVMLQSIPCSLECKIMGQILLDHPLSYALTSSADIPVVYLQQFWKTVGNVPDTKDTIKFKLDAQEITYTVDTFRDTLKLPMETPDNLFIPPVNIKVIESFMQKVSYQGVVDKVIAFYMKFLAQSWQTMFKWDFIYCVQQKKNVITYPRFIKLIIADLIKKYPSIPKQLEENYLTIKDDIPLENPKHVDDDDENKKEKKEEKNDDGEDKDNDDHTNHAFVGTQEIVELTNIVSPSTTTTSKDPHKKRHISSKYSHLLGSLLHGKVDQVLHEIVPQLAERATNDLIEGNLKRVVADVIIQERDDFQSEVPVLISKEFDAHAPMIVEELFKHYVQNNMESILQDQANDLALWDVLTHKFEKYSTSNTSCRDDDFHSQHHDDHQEDDAPLEGEKRVKRHKTSKEWDAWEEEIIIDEDEVILEDETPELMTEFQNVDKRIPTIFDRERMEATLNDMLSNQFRNAEEYAYHLEQAITFMEYQIVWNGNTKEKKYILSLHKIHAEPFLEADLEEKMNRWDRKEFKNFNEVARLSIEHWKDSWHKRVYKQNQRKVRDNPEDYFFNHKITKVVRISTDQLYGLDFMEKIIVMREIDKPDSFSEANFKYLNKNDIKDLYYLRQNRKVNYHETKLLNSLIMFIRSRVIWERVHDFQLGIDSYQIKINLTAPMLIFPGIEAHDLYSIVDKPDTGLIYLNSKNEKRVMYLVEIVKFYNATLEKVLKEVKLRIFQTKFWKKPPLLGELDLDIMKAHKREITKSLRHREQMRRWESFVNGRPILLTMKHL
ncbi:hypothetical protein Tco_0867430 [Tanacetum coccineum]